MPELKMNVFHSLMVVRTGNEWAGGIFKAFRTIPVILSIVEDMKDYVQMHGLSTLQTQVVW